MTTMNKQTKQENKEIIEVGEDISRLMKVLAMRLTFVVNKIKTGGYVHEEMYMLFSDLTLDSNNIRVDVENMEDILQGEAIDG